MYMTVKQAAEKWGISDRRVRILCAEGKISGVIHEGRRWMIPAETGKPADGREDFFDGNVTQRHQQKAA